MLWDILHSTREPERDSKILVQTSLLHSPTILATPSRDANPKSFMLFTTFKLFAIVWMLKVSSKSVCYRAGALQAGFNKALCSRAMGVKPELQQDPRQLEVLATCSIHQGDDNSVQSHPGMVAVLSVIGETSGLPSCLKAQLLSPSMGTRHRHLELHVNPAGFWSCFGLISPVFPFFGNAYPASVLSLGILPLSL